MSEKLMVNVEDIEIYDIETQEGEIPALTKEEEQANAEFLNKLGEHCAEMVTPCMCNAHEYMARQASKARLLQGTGADFVAGPDQELVDGFKFSAILVMNAEKYTAVSAVIKECKNCHRLEYFGDSSVLAQLMAEATVNRMNAEETVEVTDTSEDDLAKMLGGDISFENVEEVTHECNCESCDGGCHCQDTEE